MYAKHPLLHHSQLSSPARRPWLANWQSRSFFANASRRAGATISALHPCTFRYTHTRSHRLCVTASSPSKANGSSGDDSTSNGKGSSPAAKQQIPQSPYHGVYWHSSNGKWVAMVSYITAAGKRTTANAGCYTSDFEAAQAYNAKALEVLGPDRAQLNEVPPLEAQPEPVSQYSGVTWNKRLGKWRVAVTYTTEDGSTKVAGVKKVFQSEEDAARAYNCKARKLLGAAAQLNAVPEVKRKRVFCTPQRNPRSKYFGVSWRSEGRRHWYANVWVPGTGKRVSAGYHLTEEAAAQAYNAKALEVIGPHAPLNNVPPAPPAPPKQALPQSAFRGVLWCRKRSKWLAQVQYKRSDGRWTRAAAGYHDSEEAAAQAYNARALELIGPLAPLNDVPPAPPALPRLALPKSSYRGVYWCSRSSKWMAVVHYKRQDGRQASASAGYHDSQLAAAHAYNLRAQQVLGDMARLNNLSHHGGEKVLPPKMKHGYRGVTWDKQSRRWRATVHYNGAGQSKEVYAGTFGDVHQAARAYNALALQLLGPGAELNDVPEGV